MGTLRLTLWLGMRTVRSGFADTEGTGEMRSTLRGGTEEPALLRSGNSRAW